MNFVKFLKHPRVRQLAYIAYVRTSTFIEVRMILDMRTLTRTLIFSHDFLKFSKIFLVLTSLYGSKTYCYIF